MKKEGVKELSLLVLLVILFLFISIIAGMRVSANSLPVYVKPINADNSLNPNTTYTYTFNWTTDSACSNVIFSNPNIVVTTGTDGVGFINLTIPDTISSIPDYLCEYRNGTLRAVNALSTQFFNSVYSSGVYYGNGSGLTNLNASTLNNYNASFFMPLNTSVFGNFNFNGGWQNGGLSIIGGSLYSNGTIYSVNFSNLNVSSININGSFLPYSGYDNQFNLGNGTLRWNNIFIGGNLYSNGTLYENSVPISTKYYSINNPYSFYNSSTLPNVNASGLVNNWSLILNGTGLIQNWNASGLIINWSNAISGGGITWAQATNGTLYLSSNPYGFYNSTTLQNISQLNNNFNYYNSTTLPSSASGNPFDQVLNTTSNVTFNNLTATAINGTTVYSGNYNLTTIAGYALNSTGISWAQVTNGTLYQSSNPYSFWNSTFATFNKTYADTLYAPIAEPKAYNGSLYLSTNPYNFYNSTNPEPIINTSYYVDNVHGYYNSSSGLNNLSWANVINGTVYQSSNPFGFYNSTTLPNVNASGLINNWSLILNGTGLIQNWNSSGYIKNWNSTGLIINWSQVISGGGNPFNQILNTTSNVTFNNILLTGNLTTPQICLNGNCQSSWPAGSVSYWNQTGSNVYPANLSWHLGVGTSTPQNALNVVGDANVTGNTYLTNSKCASGDVLTTDATGLVSCTTPAGGGATLINSTTLTSPSNVLDVKFNTSGYNAIEYRIFIDGLNSTGIIQIEFNNDSGTNYGWSKLVAATSTTGASQKNCSMDTTASALIRSFVLDQFNTVNAIVEGVRWNGMTYGATASTAPLSLSGSCAWYNSTQPDINEVTIMPSSATAYFNTTSFIKIYGN